MADDARARTGGEVLKALDNGLILRKATREDAEALANFQAEQHADAPSTFDEGIQAWMLDLMSGTHPTFRPSDFMLVEDTANARIASAMCLISDVWRYGDIEVKIGQPELVATHPDYRRRGLIREQFDITHQWSEERGELIQVIAGIPWYYRQFGYEMGIPMQAYRVGYGPHVPKLAEGATEPYRVRAAAEADIPFILAMLDQQARRCLMTAVKNDEQIRYEIQGRSQGNVERAELRIIETAGEGEQAGEPVGLLVHRHRISGPTLAAFVYEIKPGASWVAVTPSVLRYMKATGEEYAQRDGGQWQAFGFMLGYDHPVYHAIPERLPRVQNGYAWYVRVPDLPGFVRHVAPALEKRLAGSFASGHTGELRLNFYRSGLLLGFEGGKLAKVEPWRSENTTDGSAAFPDLTFLQLLFGYRSLADLRYAFADCWVNGEAEALLDALFPKMTSSIWANG